MFVFMFLVFVYVYVYVLEQQIMSKQPSYICQATISYMSSNHLVYVKQPSHICQATISYMSPVCLFSCSCCVYMSISPLLSSSSTLSHTRTKTISLLLSSSSTLSHTRTKTNTISPIDICTVQLYIYIYIYIVHNSAIIYIYIQCTM